MTTTGWVILVLYSIAVIIGVTVGLIIFRSTRVGFHVRVAGRDTLERREAFWGITVVALLVILLAGTLFQVPYWSDTGEKAPQHLKITGRQFAWTVDPPRVRAHVKTRVEVRAVDVNHAVGVYDPDNRLIKQVNVLPGVAQEFVITFKKAGRYKLRCLEFCGLNHHLMENDLEVTR
jgi:cytochrome c oxidase subunit 2